MVELFDFGIRVVLALVLAVAATGKVLDPPGTRTSMASFGIPDRFASAFARIVPAAELAIAVALIIPAFAGAGLSAAFLLFAAFTAAMAIAVVRGKEGSCHCFGSIVATSFGWQAVVRNAILTLFAGIGLVVGATITRSWVPWSGDNINAGIVVLVLVIISLAASSAASLWLGLHLWQQNGRLLQRLELLESATNSAVQTSPPKRRLAPHFSLPDATGTLVSLPDLLAHGRPLLLIFSDPGCGACRELEPDIAGWQRSVDLPYTIQVISRLANRGTVAPLPGTLIQERREVMEAFGVTATPSAVIVEPDGFIRGEPLRGSPAIREHFSSATPSSAPVKDAIPGSVAPMTQAAAKARLGAVPGEETVAIFWNPSCGFCARMVEQVREVSQSLTAPVSLVLVSAGSIEATRAQNVNARIVADPGGRLMSALGGRGTPSAVAIDATGTIVSPVVVGADAVLDLVRERSTAPAAATREAMSR